MPHTPTSFRPPSLWPQVEMRFPTPPKRPRKWDLWSSNQHDRSRWSPWRHLDVGNLPTTAGTSQKARKCKESIRLGVNFGQQEQWVGGIEMRPWSRQGQLQIWDIILLQQAAVTSPSWPLPGTEWGRMGNSQQPKCDGVTERNDQTKVKKLKPSATYVSDVAGFVGERPWDPRRVFLPYSFPELFTAQISFN